MTSQLAADQSAFVGTPRGPPLTNPILGLPPHPPPPPAAAMMQKTMWDAHGIVSAQPSVVLAHGSGNHGKHGGQSTPTVTHFDGMRKPSGRQKYSHFCSDCELLSILIISGLDTLSSCSC